MSTEVYDFDSQPRRQTTDARKMLCGRLLYFETIQAHRDLFNQCGASPAITSLQHSFFNFIDQYKDKAGAKGANSYTFIEELFSYFLDIAEPTLKIYPQVFDVFKTTVSAKRSQIDCQNCSLPTAQIRLGATPVSSTQSCCKGSLHQTFDFAYEVAKSYYSAYSSHPKCSLPEVSLSITLHRDKVHDLPSQFSTNGLVKFSSSGQAYKSEIELLLHIDDFNLDSYLVVPYIFFHECIAHAFHGILPAPLNRQVNDPDDEFAEGWMDFIAFKVLEEVTQGKGPAKQLLSGIRFTDEHYNRCYNLHYSRTDLNVSPPNRQSIYAIRRKSGHTAAEKVLRVLERLEPQGSAWEIFLRMSFDLNMTQKFGPILRQQFVALISNLSKPGEIDTPRHCDIVPLIRKYIKTEDLDGFVQDVIGLRTLWAKKYPFIPPNSSIIH